MKSSGLLFKVKLMSSLQCVFHDVVNDGEW
jgi:hypothetical protein